MTTKKNNRSANAKKVTKKHDDAIDVESHYVYSVAVCNGDKKHKRVASAYKRAFDAFCDMNDIEYAEKYPDHIEEAKEVYRDEMPEAASCFDGLTEDESIWILATALAYDHYGNLADLLAFVIIAADMKKILQFEKTMKPSKLLTIKA